MTDPDRNNRSNAHNARIGGVAISFFFDYELPKPEIIQDGDPIFDDVSPKLKLQVCEGQPLEWKEKEQIFDAGTTWALFGIKDRYLLQDASVHSENYPSKFLILDRDMESGVLYIDRNIFRDLSLNDPLGYPLNQVLMIMLLSQGRGMLLHACGVDDNGAGYMFAGNSGHGKSTMANLWHEQGALVLNDDRMVVREKDGVLWMYGTPWHGDFKEHSTGGLPIQKVFFLSRGNSNTVCPKHGAKAVSMLLTRSFPPLWDKQGMAFNVDFCHRLVEKVPCYELSFLPDTRIVDFVRNI